MKNLVVFDIETTGLDKQNDHIIQFAALKINRETNEVLDTINTYIRPEGNYSISVNAYFKHHIKPEDLLDKPTFRNVADRILEFFKDCDILTYNGTSFDIPILIREFERIGMEVSFADYDKYDAFLEERRRNGLTLEMTYQRYTGKTMEEAGLTAHDALGDIKATYTIFSRQQHKQAYGPEKLITDDNIITYKEINGQEIPCFNVGKYNGQPLALVRKTDYQYLKWCVSESCNFSKQTKKYISENYI